MSGEIVIQSKAPLVSRGMGRDRPSPLFRPYNSSARKSADFRSFPSGTIGSFRRHDVEVAKIAARGDSARSRGKRQEGRLRSLTVGFRVSVAFRPTTADGGGLPRGAISSSSYSGLFVKGALMINRVFGPREGDPPPSRLESWLERKVQGGGLNGLPRYCPPGDRLSHCPEHYARALLSRVHAALLNPSALERVKDDGRAFRSWTEAVLLSLAG